MKTLSARRHLRRAEPPKAHSLKPDGERTAHGIGWNAALTLLALLGKTTLVDCQAIQAVLKAPPARRLLRLAEAVGLYPTRCL